MADQHEYADLAASIQQELDDTAKAVGPALPFAQPGSGAQRLTKQQMLAHVRFNWTTTPGFPQALLDRMAPPYPGQNGQQMRPEAGVKAYHALVSEAFPEGSPQWHAQQAAALAPAVAMPVGAANGVGIGGQGMNVAQQQPGGV